MTTKQAFDTIRDMIDNRKDFGLLVVHCGRTKSATGGRTRVRVLMTSNDQPTFDATALVAKACSLGLDKGGRMLVENTWPMDKYLAKDLRTHESRIEVIR